MKDRCSVSRASPPGDVFAPRYWPTWLGIGAIRCLAPLPLPVLRALGGAFGVALFHAHGSRRRVALRNIRACFPELAARAQRRLAREHFICLGREILTTGINWFAPPARLDRLFVVEGEHHLKSALAARRNVVLLVPHFVALEIGGIFLSRFYPSLSMYRTVKNRCMDHAARKGRGRFEGGLIERGASLRGLVRELRSGKLFYYLPDQDPGPKKGVFAPFFGVEAATLPALSRFARLGDAVVIPCLTEQLERGWRLRFLAPLEDFPGDDAVRDARRMNALIESAVRETPAQYFWVHRRFKTRPRGAPPIY